MPNDATPTPPTPTPWFAGKEGVDAETVGYFTTRGWDKDPSVAAIEASKAHRAAEKFIGVPTSELVRVPKEANDARWPEIWQRLGMPKDAAGYDLSNVKGTDDKPLNGAMLDQVRKLAHSLNLPADRAPLLAQELVKLNVEHSAGDDAQRAVKLDEERAALKTNWGNHFEANKFIARNAALKLGVTPVEVDALEQVIGYAKVMEMLRNIGVRMGEDKFVRNDAKPGGGVFSREEAASRLAELKADRDWVKRYSSGGAAEKREMDGLLRIISGVS
jgi:hypothetical protein